MADSQSPVEWSEVRARFPALVGRVYLNTATMGQMPKAATDAMVAHLSRRDAMACADLLDWFDDLERIRAKAARLINAASADVTFVPSTAHALALLLNGIAWQPGDRVLTLEDEFPNNTYAPSLLERQGVQFVEVPRERLAESLDQGARLVIASVMSYLDGYRFPVADLRDKLDRAGTLLYLDGTQGCGALHLDVEKIRPDVLGVHGYKWMLSPTGAGFAYVRPSVRQWLEPNVIGWRSHHSWQDLDNLHHGMPEWAATAHRYEGYMPALPLLYAMEQSVDLMLELDPRRIEQRVLGLAAAVQQVVEDLGGTVANANSPIVACRFPGRDASELSRALQAHSVLSSARHGFLRISVHLYNNEQDVQDLARALRELLASPANV